MVYVGLGDAMWGEVLRDIIFLYVPMKERELVLKSP